MNFNGFHYDIARGAYLRPNVFIEAMQLAADNGFTQFIPYLENMIRLPSMERACPSCAYTTDQWREFEHAANGIGIDIVPHFNVIGHSTQICEAYPSLAGPHGGHELDVTLPEVHRWLTDCLEEFCACSTSQWFLIGGDEWLAPNHLRSNPDFDVAKAWSEQVNRAVEFLDERGRTAIVWHDMLMHYPDALDYLSPKAVLAFWFYDHDSDYPAISTMKAKGFRVIMASGILGRQFTHRTTAAIKTALQAAKKHQADGLMMTSWETTPWETQSSAIPLTAEAYVDKPLPQAILNGGALYACLCKLPMETPAYQELTTQLAANLAAEEWSRFPLHHHYLQAWLDGDRQSIVEGYTRHHFPEGPLYDRLLEDQASPALKPPFAAATPPGTFELQVRHDEQAGDVLTICHGEERFMLYPYYGASLQNWTYGTATIFPHTMPAFLKRPKEEPGGYRSWSAVGGFRPIWAIGTHHNPCILWQYPWEWEVVIQTPERISLCFHQSLSHAEVNYLVTVVRDEPGIYLAVTATNKLANAYGGFSFNIPLALDPLQLQDTRFAWDDQDQGLFEPVREAFWIPARDELRVTTPNWSLTIECEPEETAGFFVDWSSALVTPDLHGIYKPRQIGETATVTWHFIPGT